jgi:hypothetical protein
MYGVALVRLDFLLRLVIFLPWIHTPIKIRQTVYLKSPVALKEGGGENKRAHEIVAKLDAIGNTTKAL